MKLLLIGHCSRDVIHATDGSSREEYGGILHALRVLSELLEKSDRVTPICGVHRDEHAPFTSFLQQLPGVDTEGVFLQDAPLHLVHYYPGPGGTQIECTKQIAPPIPFDRIRGFLPADGILVNMVSGSDITLETMDEIRMAVRQRGTVLHLDFHGLTTGINEKWERFRRPLPEWRRWAFMMDTVQLNEEEVAGLTMEQADEETTVGHMLTLGTKGVVVTRGARGVSLYTIDKKKLLRRDIGGGDALSPAARIGRGDMFGAAFIHGVVAGGELHGAAASAHAIASRSPVNT